MPPQIDGDDLPVYSPTCVRCVRLTDLGLRQCEAFPQGIPEDIWRGDDPHTEPRAGDRGLTFLARPYGAPPDA